MPLEYYTYYEPAYYSFRIHEIDVWKSNTEIVDSSSTLKLWLYSNQSCLQLQSDFLDPKFTIDFDKVHSYYYTTFDTKAHCTVETGCNVN